MLDRQTFNSGEQACSLYLWGGGFIVLLAISAAIIGIIHIYNGIIHIYNAIEAIIKKTEENK